MNDAQLTDWVARLRSGDYAQGQLQLRITTHEERRYCCLGVLADMLVEAEPEKFVWEEDILVVRADEPYDYESCQRNDYDTDLMRLKYDATGLGHQESSIVDLTVEQQYQLMELNDSGKGFDEIADWIEENLR